MERWWCLLASIGLACSPPLTAVEPEGSGGDPDPAASTSGSPSGPTAADETGAAGAEGTTAGPTGEEGDDPTGESPAAMPGYGAVHQKSSHNSYQRDEALVDQLAYHRVRSLELDLHDSRIGVSVDGDWFVYHDTLDTSSSCTMLADCLGEVRTFTLAVPGHEVITLWLDLKDDWGGSHTPAALDAVLQAGLGAALWGPDDLRAGCPGAPDLASAATDPACGWPLLADLRGRVIVILTGRDDPLADYRAEGTRAFVAPDLTDPDQLGRASPEVAVYNTEIAADIAAEATAAITAAAEAGFVVRAWGANDEGTWNQARDAGAHHIATDRVNLHEDPWAVTHDAEGWPFTCVEPCEPIGPEPGTIIGLEVDSGDIWDTTDHMLFLYQDRGATPDGDLSAMVSTPNSHVERFAKGCLMARAGLDAGAPYLAVCRPADGERLRVQVRLDVGATSMATEHDVVLPDSVEPTSVAWVRLEVDSAGYCATGYGAWQRGAWVSIFTQCFTVPLTHQGLAASSHDGGRVKFLFVDPRRGEASLEVGDYQSLALGNASGQGFDGVFP